MSNPRSLAPTKDNMRRRIAELEAALIPFAGIAQFVERMSPQTGVWVHANNKVGNYVVTVADVRRAQAAMADHIHPVQRE